MIKIDKLRFNTIFRFSLAFSLISIYILAVKDYSVVIILPCMVFLLGMYFSIKNIYNNIFLFSFLLPPFCLKPCSGKPLLFSCNYIRNTLCPVAGSLAKCLPNDLWKYHLFSDICYYITLSNLRCNMFMNIFPSFRSDLSFINLSIFVHYFFIS